jgi:hypothetical protein
MRYETIGLSLRLCFDMLQYDRQVLMPLALVQRYVGWLLRVNRRLGQDKALRSGRSFAAAFRRAHTPPLAPSQVTRMPRSARTTAAWMLRTDVIKK